MFSELHSDPSNRRVFFPANWHRRQPAKVEAPDGVAVFLQALLFGLRG